MPQNRLLLAIVSLAGSITYGQSAILHFVHTEGTGNIQEITTAIRTIADIRETQADPAQKTLEVRGTGEQMALAEWLFEQLDQPVVADQGEGSPEYRVKGDGENTVRIFYMPGQKTIQQFQEAATAIRTVADVRRVFTYNAPRAMIARGTPDQIALTAWLVDQIGRPAGQEYRMPADADPRGDVVVRVLHVEHADSIQSFQEVATAIRTIANIRRVFTYNPAQALLVRATAGQIALADWLLKQLDLPEARTGSSAAYQFDNDWDPANNMVRVFYLPQVSAERDLQQMATNIRATAHARAIFTYNQRRALALRGTIDQLTQAELIVGQGK